MASALTITDVPGKPVSAVACVCGNRTFTLTLSKTDKGYQMWAICMSCPRIHEVSNYQPE